MKGLPTAEEWSGVFPCLIEYPTSLTHARTIRDGLIKRLIKDLQACVGEEWINAELEEFCRSGGRSIPMRLASRMTLQWGIDRWSLANDMDRLSMVAKWIYWQEREVSHCHDFSVPKV